MKSTLLKPSPQNRKITKSSHNQIIGLIIERKKKKMRFTPILRATRRKAKPLIPILPPLPLYRRVLRANRKLDPQVRLLGDDYVKAEFRAHKTTDNPLYIIGFLTQWQVS